MELIRESFYHAAGVDELTRKEHSHPDTYELIQVLSGEGEFIIDAAPYRFRAGTVLLIDAERFHYSMPRDPDGYIRNKLIFSKSKFVLAAQALGLREQTALLFDNENNHAVCLDEKTAWEADKSFQLLCREADPFRSAAALIDLIRTLWENVHPPAGRSDALAVILDEVNASVGSEFSLEELSRKVCVSKYYLCHCFKEKTGMTISDYLKWKRMDLAGRMLRESKAPVSQIALSCGYNSPAYFSKCFKAAVGTTPSGYRKMHRKRL